VSDEAPTAVTELAYDDTDLRAEISGLDRRLIGALDALKEHVRSENESLRMGLHVLEEKITDLRGQIDGQQRALLAIYHRERMLAIADVLDRDSLELGRPLDDGKTMDEEEWESWKADAQQWEIRAHEWAKWAAFYCGRDPVDDIKRITVEGLNENWGAKANQFPDPEGLRIYKTFRIQVRNWACMRDVAHEKARRTAFEGVAV